MPVHDRVDRVRHLLDLALRRAYRDGPVRRAAHHHALEDGLSSDWVTHEALVCLERQSAAAGAAGLLETALETLDAAASIDELLLARVVRVAGRADLDVELGLRRTGLKLVAAGAANGRKDVLRMDVSLHWNPEYQRLFGQLRCLLRLQQPPSPRVRERPSPPSALLRPPPRPARRPASRAGRGTERRRGTRPPRSARPRSPATG